MTAFLCAGVDGFNSRVLSKKFSRYWTSAESVQRYYNATGSRGNHQLHLANDEFREYCKWTPFADAWDVRPPASPPHPV